MLTCSLLIRVFQGLRERRRGRGKERVEKECVGVYASVGTVVKRDWLVP